MASEWISVSERLPEVDGIVLASNGSDVSACFFKQYDKFFRHLDDYFYWKPTHWMPLPEPPEVK